MPDLDGLETLRAIRQAHPAAQVIMLSGRQAPATIVEAVRLGAADYVLKPGDPDGVGEAALEAAIRNALERESLSAEVARLRRAGRPRTRDGAQPCWSSGTAMQPVMAMVERVADSDVERAAARRERRRQGSDRARAAPALAAAHRSRSSRSTARRCRPTCSRASCSATSAAPSPAPARRASASSSSPSTARSCSTRSARCRRRCRPSCCTCCRIASSRGSAATGRSTSTCASSPRPTATSRR